MTRLISAFIILLIVLLVVLFVVFNADKVAIDLYFIQTPPISLGALFVIALAIGTVIGMCSSLFVILSSRREVSKLRRSIKQTEQEVMNLRSIPIKDKH